MLPAVAVVLMLNTRGVMFDATPVGYFKAAVREKDVVKKGEWVEKGLASFDPHSEETADELDRVFPLYLGLLGADLPIPAGLMMAEAAMVFPLTAATRALAAETLEAYRDKIRGTKEEVAPRSESGAFSGPFPPGSKASGVLQQYIDAIKSGDLPFGTRATNSHPARFTRPPATHGGRRWAA